MRRIDARIFAVASVAKLRISSEVAKLIEEIEDWLLFAVWLSALSTSLLYPFCSCYCPVRMYEVINHIHNTPTRIPDHGKECKFQIWCECNVTTPDGCCGVEHMI